MKHRSRAVEVHSLLCHDTLDAAKAALIGRMKARIDSVEEMEFDPENFWVA